MTAYRKIIIGTIVLTAVLAVLTFFLQTTQANFVLASVLVGEAVADVAATFYIGRLAYTDSPRSWLMLFLVVGASFITIGYLIVGGIIVLRAAGIILPPGLGLSASTVAVTIIGAVPAMKALLFFLVQRDQTVDAGVVADVPGLVRALLDHDVQAALAEHDVAAAATKILAVLGRRTPTPPLPVGD